jgi:hypothetical protein
VILLLLFAAAARAGVLDAPRFRPLDPFPLAIGDDAGAQAFALADVNGDLLPDLITIDDEEDELLILLGVGDGTFEVPQRYLVDGTPTAVTVADLASPVASEAAGDADGHPDVVVTFDDGSAAIYLGRGDGCFDEPEQDLSEVLDASEIIGVVAADFDADDRNDLALLDLFDEVYFLCNLRGNLAPCLTDVVETLGTEPIAIAGGDFDGDTSFDVAVLNFDSHNLSPLFNRGDGAFEAALPVSTSATGHQQPAHFAAGRLNADLSDDIVVVNRELFADFSVVALYGRPDRGFLNRIFPAPFELTSSALGDLDGDGALDLVMLSAALSSPATLSLGDGEGGFAEPVEPAGLPTLPQRAVVLADLDGDTRLDAVFLNAEGTEFQVSLNRGVICAGDCDQSQGVSINELVLAVAIALGSSPASSCIAADIDASNSVEINELVAAVARALGGCP